MDGCHALSGAFGPGRAAREGVMAAKMLPHKDYVGLACCLVPAWGPLRALSSRRKKNVNHPSQRAAGHCGSNNVHFLMLGTWDRVTLHGKGDLAEVIKVKILRWGNYPGLSGQAPPNHRGPYKREAEKLM